MSCVGKAWNGVKPPCKDCTKRHVGCHSKCPEYIKYSEENARVRGERHKENLSYNPNADKYKGRR